ncbi:MAG TPA: ABC transporter ATP-binding protein [Chloroflexota bacterium]
MTLLKVESLDARHGLLQAVREVSFTVSEGETVALVGANGAGKTTLLRALAGAHRPSGGDVIFDEVAITNIPAYRRVRMGIVLVPEGRRLFPSLTVEENLLLATASGRSGVWNIETVLDAFPILRSLRRRPARNLSGGEQQAAAIGRGLMSNPRLLLLDEVSLGLAPVAIEAVYASVRTLIQNGTTILLVEQDLSRAMRVATRILCLLEGRVVLEGTPADLTRERIAAAYFGLGRTSGQETA